MTAFPDPLASIDLGEQVLAFLDFHRGVAAAKLSGLSDDALHRSVVPSAWTPADLVNHLIQMERRWVQWGFLAEDVGDPWGDREDDDSWVHTTADASTLVARLHDVGARTRHVVATHDLAERAGVGGRFATVAEAPQLQWILLHVLQEYARHVGHLDIARELIDGALSEEG